MDRHYELKLADGRMVQWNGKSGEDAALRYVDTYRETTVVAWRECQCGSCSLVIGWGRHSRIIE